MATTSTDRFSAIPANLVSRGRVRVASTAAVTIATALNDGDTLDGKTLVTGDLVLLKDQAAPADNGVYVVGTSPGRAPDFATYNDHPGSLISVIEGTANAGTLWYGGGVYGGTLGTTAITFTSISLVGFGVLTPTDNGVVIGNGSAFIVESGATLKTSLGLTIGADIQAWDVLLDQIAALADPNADRILFWDDSAGALVFLTAGTGLTITTTTIAVTSASDSAAGIQENAVQSEMETGTSTTLTVTPGRQHFHPGHPKCWAMATVSAGTPTLAASYNITSITDSAQGKLTVTIATDFSSANWCCLSTNTLLDNDVGNAAEQRNNSISSMVAGSVMLHSVDDATGASGADYEDPDAWHMAGWGDHA